MLMFCLLHGSMFRNRYSKSCDVWGLGVIVYIMLSGDAPFDAGDCGADDCMWREGEHCSACLENLQDEITEGRLGFDGPQWANISDSAKDLIRRMLVPEEKRISAEEILRHKWVMGSAPETELATPDVLRQPQKLEFCTTATIRVLDGPEDTVRRKSFRFPRNYSLNNQLLVTGRRRRKSSAVPSQTSAFDRVLDIDTKRLVTPAFARVGLPGRSASR